MSSTIYHLEMCAREELQAACGKAALDFQEVRDPQTSKRLYQEVGSPWQWTDRLVWTGEQWRERVTRPAVLTWVVLFQGDEAGYLEVERQSEGQIEMVYFGLHSRWIGKGLGGVMLTRAVEMVWDLEGTTRVWLHTCSEDHPHALGNYEKRGFRRFAVESR